MNSIEMHQQLIDQRRGRYVRVSDIDRRQLIDTYKSGGDFIALAKKLNIKRSTARSILRTFIDEGRVSAKQRAGTRLRFITEEEAELIREMKRRHPLITIGQIQMRLQRTSNRVLSKASISRILTNSIRLGKRAKRFNGEDDDGGQDGVNELMQLSSDEGPGTAFYIDEEGDDDEDEEEEILDTNPAEQNLDDFQRFMFRKTSVNGDESNGNEGLSWDTKEQYDDHGYPVIGSEEDEELSEIDENEMKSSVDLPLDVPLTHPPIDENPLIKSEPVCVFVNRNFDSSDSETPAIIDEGITKSILNTQSTANRRVKVCPICGEQNFSRLSHHLTVSHNLNRNESLTLLAYTDRSNVSHPSIATVSGSSPIDSSTNHPDKSPQQTPITINTNNQQITSSESSPPINDSNTLNPILTTNVSSNEPQVPSGSLTADGKKRLLCPRCDTWVLNLTDHLIKKHHLVSKQERLPFLRLARTRDSTMNSEKSSPNAFLISPNEQSKPTIMNKNYHNIIKKYRKTSFNSIPASSSPLSNHETSSSLNSNSSKQIVLPRNLTKDLGIHQKFEKRLSVFSQQFAATVTLQNSLMQQMELLQRSFVSIEEEWNDMKKEVFASIS